MRSSFAKMGVGTALIIVAYFAIVFAFLNRDQKLQDQIVDLTLQRDELRSRLRAAEEINAQLQTRIAIARVLGSTPDNTWRIAAGLDLASLPEEERPEARLALEIIEGLQKDVSLWPRTDGPEILARFAKVRPGSRAPVRGLSRVLQESTDTSSRQSAAILLGRLKVLKCVDALTKGLEDDSEPVRQASAAALGEIGGGTASANLLRALEHDPNSTVRLSAARALATCGAWMHSEGLANRLDSEPSAEVRAEIVSTIARIGAPTTNALLSHALSDQSRLVRALAEDELDRRGALTLPLPDEAYRVANLADFHALERSGRVARVTRRDGFVYYEVDMDTVTSRDRKDRAWFRATER